MRVKSQVIGRVASLLCFCQVESSNLSLESCDSSPHLCLQCIFICLFVCYWCAAGSISWPMGEHPSRWVLNVLRSSLSTEPCGCRGTCSMWWTRWSWRRWAVTLLPGYIFWDQGQMIGRHTNWLPNRNYSFVPSVLKLACMTFWISYWHNCLMSGCFRRRMKFLAATWVVSSDPALSLLLLLCLRFTEVHLRMAPSYLKHR